MSSVITISGQRLDEVYQQIKSQLQTSEAETEARIILESIANASASDLILGDKLLTNKQINTICDIIHARNKKRIPLAYLLEEARFFGLDFFVNDTVLVPRPETEELVSLVLEEIKQRDMHKPVILDLCTGSGCIAISLKKSLPAATIYASDISKAALNVANINAQRNKTEVHYVLGDYLDPFMPKDKRHNPFHVPIIRGQAPYFDVIVSNPPYISEEDYQKLEAELFHEPKHALVGFPYKYIQDQAKTLIKPGGFLAFEHGQGQGLEISCMFPGSRIINDLSGIDRFVITK